MKCMIVGYTAAPTGKADAVAYYQALAKIPEASGLQFAWLGPETCAQIQHVLDLLPSSWTIMLNGIAATAQACAVDPAFGLASPDEAGRAAAMRMLRDVNAGIKALNDRAGRRLVSAFELHCAPGFGQREFIARPEAFRRSLDEAVRLDWDGCSVMVEHCDAFVAGQKCAKGFLQLDEEIAALKGIEGSPIGLSLNWGRSLVELHDPSRVVEHVIAAEASGMLKAFTFSGTAAVDNLYGDAWGDLHLPFSDTEGGTYSEPTSLLSTALADAVLNHLGTCEFVAVKTNWPAMHSNALERASSVEANFYTLLEVLRRHETWRGSR